MNTVRKDLKPIILKAGFALLAGIVVGVFTARCRPRRATISPPPPPLHIADLELEPGSSAGVVVGELPMHQIEESLTKISPSTTVTVEEDEEKFTEFPLPTAFLTEDLEKKDSVAMEEEIENLRNLVKSLQEREICLEMKLLEYHGLKEQEVLMGELHNRLKISATETKLLSLKIESLKAENEKLRAEASDYSRVVSELVNQRENVAVLESKLKFVGEQAKEKIEVLHGRIIELRDKEKKELEDSLEVDKKLFNRMENDVIELGKDDSKLEQEKTGMIRKLESSVLRSPDSVLKIPELGTLEEQNQLREENENLKKKLEQLQVDRCEDVEELVYLRWVNACLRYELRNYQPPPGRTIARDLSSCLSPKSEQKAKQLILDYSNSHLNSNRSSLMDFDLDDCFSQTSSEEFDDNSLDSSKTKSSKSSKSKLVNKLKKLVLPKSRNEDKMVLNSERRASASTCAIDDCRRKSFGSTSGLSVEKTNNSTGVEFNGNEKWQIKRNLSHDLPCSSLDVQNLRRLKQEQVNGGMPERCYSDLGVVYDHKRMLSLDDNTTYNSSADCEEGENHEKEKLKKFAQVFKESLGSLKSKRLPSSLSIG